MLLLAALASGCGSENVVSTANVEVLAYGIFEHERVVVLADSTSSVGAKRAEAHGLRIATATDRIPLRPGTDYGVAFRVTGLPSEEVQVRVVLRTSSPCVLKDSGKTVYHNDSVMAVKVGQPRHVGARIPASEAENHCVGAPQPGTDTFEFYIGYAKLAEKTFHIYGE